MQLAATTVRARRSTGSDRAFLRALFAESRPELALLPEPVRDHLTGVQFDSQSSSYRRAAPDAVDWILEIDGEGGRPEPVGRCYVWQQPHEHRLLDLAIRQAWRRRGIGSTVLERLRDEAGRAGVPLRLAVWADNGDALRLYLRHGFVLEEGDAGAVPAGYRRLGWTAGGGS